MSAPLQSFAGTAVYVDAMLLVAYLRPQSPWYAASVRFIQRAVDPAHPITLITASLTVDEAVFVLLQELLLDPPFSITRSRSQYLSGHPDTVRQLMAAIDGPLQTLLDVLQIEPVLPDDTTAMRQEMLASGTLPRDAIHVAVMRRLGLAAIATDDEGFERCAGITVYKP